ncbi:NUDIX hydrolase [Sphingobium lignivorans]|uniref:8-oxo-dGTP diphosphatase n=1 Tax=Sphingobium lignivorans TaxID=2735886 RepID=A0ABR6NI67_9SPHN|nr:NUDIX domain-containing protein [Sphingobium lignivorans]MBB5986973.1 8-oxo-dGTP diphosphatase [Sphingobium lignivorans]
MHPAFGQKLAGRDYVERPGAYAFILDAEGRLALIRPQAGRHFLPGGGIEAGETPTDCLLREIVEEMGWRGRVTTELGQATLFTQGIDGRCWTIRAHYFRAYLIERLPMDGEHDCLWMPPSHAAPLLTRESDRWALGRFLLGRAD